MWQPIIEPTTICETFQLIWRITIYSDAEIYVDIRHKMLITSISRAEVVKSCPCGQSQLPWHGECHVQSIRFNDWFETNRVESSHEKTRVSSGTYSETYIMIVSKPISEFRYCRRPIAQETKYCLTDRVAVQRQRIQFTSKRFIPNGLNINY